MLVFGEDVLHKAAKKHADLRAPLAAWLKVAESSAWKSLDEIRKTYPSADAASQKYVFNLKGNNYRLIAAINFEVGSPFHRPRTDPCGILKGEMEMSATTTGYAELLSAAEPQVIHSDQTYRRFMKTLRSLSARWRSLSKAERKLFELLSMVVKEYERRSYTVQGATPIDVVEHLLDVNGLKRKDLIGIFESASVVSDVLNGKRSLTVQHIKRLSERFHVSPAVFF